MLRFDFVDNLTLREQKCFSPCLPMSVVILFSIRTQTAARVLKTRPTLLSLLPPHHLQRC